MWTNPSSSTIILYKIFTSSLTIKIPERKCSNLTFLRGTFVYFRAAKIETARETKERIAREGKKYWEKLTQVLPEKTFRVWKVKG
jgi:hypothetical protein